MTKQPNAYAYTPSISMSLVSHLRTELIIDLTTNLHQPLFSPKNNNSETGFLVSNCRISSTNATKPFPLDIVPSQQDNSGTDNS